MDPCDRARGAVAGGFQWLAGVVTLKVHIGWERVVLAIFCKCDSIWRRIVCVGDQLDRARSFFLSLSEGLVLQVTLLRVDSCIRVSCT